MQSCELLNIEGTCNTRDIGGIVNESGKTLNKRRFIRSAALSAIKEAGIRYIYGLGVDCILDIRTMEERVFDPCSFENDSKVEYIHKPLKDFYHDVFNKGKADCFPTTKSDLYMWTLENNREIIRDIMLIFANKRYKTIVFHCSSGKDRTGLIAMLLLEIAGVDDQTIIQDYCLSKELLVNHRNTKPFKRDKRMPAYYFDVRREYIERLIDNIREIYGNVLNFLINAGLSTDDLEQIRAKLLENGQQNADSSVKESLRNALNF